MFVAQGNRDPVDLGFHHILQVLPADNLPHPFVKFAQVIRRIGIVHAQHGHGVPNRFEPLQRSATHPLGRRIRRYQFGMLTFQLL